MDINFVFNDYTVTQSSVKKENIDLLLYLLSIGGENECTQSSFAPPLMIAAENNNIFLVKLLLEKGADVDEESIDGYTALYSIAELGYIECAKILIEHGADVNYSIINEDNEDSHLCVYSRALVYKQYTFADFISHQQGYVPK